MKKKNKIISIILLLLIFSPNLVTAKTDHYINFEKSKITNSYLITNKEKYHIHFSSNHQWLDPSLENIWIENNIKKKGRNSIGYKLNPDEDRIETKLDDIKNKTIKYISFNIYFPSNYNPPTHWNLFAQWWQGSPASPAISFELDPQSEDFQMMIISRDGTVENNKIKTHYKDEIEKEKWINFIVKFRVDDTGGEKGILEVWKDGEKIVNYNGELGYTDLNDSTNFRFGIYRSTNNNDTVEAYYDEILMGDNFKQLITGRMNKAD